MGKMEIRVLQPSKTLIKKEEFIKNNSSSNACEMVKKYTNTTTNMALYLEKTPDA